MGNLSEASGPACRTTAALRLRPLSADIRTSRSRACRSVLTLKRGIGLMPHARHSITIQSHLPLRTREIHHAKKQAYTRRD